MGLVDEITLEQVSVRVLKLPTDASDSSIFHRRHIEQLSAQLNRTHTSTLSDPTALAARFMEWEVKIIKQPSDYTLHLQSH